MAHNQRDLMQVNQSLNARKKEALLDTIPTRNVKPCNKCGGIEGYAPRSNNSLGNCKRCTRRQVNFYYKQKLVKQKTKTQEDNS
jgi:hypothetical protein